MQTSLSRQNRPTSPCWAIQLSNSEDKHWAEKGDETSSLTYQWKDISFDTKDTLHTTAILVAKQNPQLGVDEIDKKAEGIHGFNGIRINDCIFTHWKKLAM